MKKLLLLSAILILIINPVLISQTPEDETDIMGVCPTKIITGNGAITVNYSKAGKMIAYYTPNVGSFNIIPYQTTTNKNDTIRYGAQPFEGLFAGIEVNGSFKWLHQLYPTVIKYNNDNSPEILIQYTYPTANGPIYIDQTCIVGSPESHPKVAVESYKIRNSSTQQVSVKFIYYGFIHPTIRNQQPPLYILGDEVPLLGWQYLSPNTTKAEKHTNYIVVGPDPLITNDGQYFNFGVALNNETTLQTIDKTIFSIIPLLTSGVYNDNGPDFNWPTFNSTFSSGEKVNWAVRYDLGLITGSGGEKIINCFFATGVDENWANQNLNNAVSLGIDLIKNQFTQWWENEIDTVKINNTFSENVEKKLFKRWIVTSRLMVDTDSGAIIASPNRQPKYFGTWVRDGMYQALFWEAWGRDDIVDKFIDFLIRRSEEKVLSDGKTGRYWKQNYSIAFDPGSNSSFIGLPWGDEIPFVNPIDLKIQNDQMGTFLSTLFIIAKHRNRIDPLLGLPSTPNFSGAVRNTRIREISNYLVEKIVKSDLLYGTKLGLLQPSVDIYEFPAGNVLTAFMDPSKAAIGQSIYTNSAAVSGLRAAAYFLSDDSLYYESNKISLKIKEYFQDPSLDNFKHPSFVLKGEFEFFLPPLLLTFKPSIFGTVESQRNREHTISVGWPYNVYGMEDHTTKNYSTVVESCLDSIKSQYRDKIFTPRYLMSAIYDMYKPIDYNSARIEEFKTLIYYNHQGIWYVPENFHNNGPNDYWGQGATPLGWSQAWSALALLLKQKTTPAERDLVLPIFDLGGSQITTPSAPTLISPANNSTNIVLTPTCTWSDVLNSLHLTGESIDLLKDSSQMNPESLFPGYWLQVSSNASFANLQVDQSGISDSFYNVPSGRLVGGTQYWWRVKAVNINRDSSYWSSVYNFTTLSGGQSPPQPRLISPPDNSTNIPLTQLLNWNDTTNVNYYRIQIATVLSFNTMVVDTTLSTNLSQFSIPPGKLVGSTLYYWHVLGINSSGSGPWSVTWKFTTISAPGSCQRPQLQFPSNGATGISITPILQWAAVPNAVSYTMALANNPTFNNLILSKSGILTTSYSVPPDTLEATKTYYWHVYTACTGNQVSNWSDTYSFTTSSYQIPGVPELTSPNQGAVGQPLDVTLNWIDVINASSYDVQVATDIYFNNLIVQKFGIQISEYTFAAGELSYLTTYYWRVRAYNYLGPGNWSQYRYFTTLDVTPPAVPILLSPADNSINEQLTPTLDWNDVIGATKYRLQVSTNPGFTSFVVDAQNLVNSFFNIEYGMLNNNIKYYWRVCSFSSGYYSNYCSAWNFTTLAAISPPPAPSLILPNNGSTNLPLSLTLKWGVVTGASKYRCMVSTDSIFSSTILDVSNIDSTQYTLPAYLLSYNQEYYWRVNGYNAAGNSPWSTIWNFTTMVQPLIQQPTNIDLINFGQIIDIKIQNQFAYCLTEAGLFRINIEDPYHPYIKNSITLPADLNNYCRLLVKDEYAFISNGASGITIVNISSPNDLYLASTVTGIGNITEIAIKDSALYGLEVNSDLINIISIKDPINPYYISEFNATKTYYQRVYSLATAGNYLFCGSQNGRIWRWTITNPYNPSPGIIIYENGAIAWFGQLLYDNGSNYLFAEERTPNSGGGKVCTFTVNLTTGQLTLRNQTIQGEGIVPFHLSISNNYLYLTAFDGYDTRIWDISNISSPIQSNTIRPTISNYDNALGIETNSGYCFLGTSGKLLVCPLNYDLSISRLDASGNFNDVKTKGNNLYAAAGTKGLLIYDLTNRASPVQISNLSFDYGVERIYVDSSNYIYCIANEKVYVVNISNPSVPTIVSNFSIPYKVAGSNQNCYIKELVVKNNFAYVFFMYRIAYTIPSLEEKGMAVINLNDISNPSISGKFYFNDDSRNVAAMLVGNNIYSIERRYFAEGVGGTWTYTGVNKIAKYSISNPTNPTLALLKNITDYPIAFDLIDNLFYIVTGPFGGYSDPSATTIKYVNNNNFDIERNIPLNALPSFIKVTNNNIFLTKGNEFNIFERDTNLTFIENTTFPYGAGRFVIDSIYVNLSNNYSMTTFTINNQISPPSKPQLLSPINGSLNNSIIPVLDWTDIVGAQMYGVQIATDINFSNVIFNQTGLITSQYYIPLGMLSYNTLYYWRVKASNEGGASPWSDVWSFNTVSEIPGPPILTSPLNGSSVYSLMPTLDWQDVPNAIAYHIQLASIENNSIILDSSGITSSQLIIPTNLLNYNTQYYWRVKSANIIGEGEWSTAWEFTTTQGIILNLSILIEGFYNPSTKSMRCRDTLNVELRSITTHSNIIDSSSIVVDTLGQGIAIFGLAETGNYYLVIKHRNSIETWSKIGGEYLIKGVTASYDFTSDSTSAYENNLVRKGSQWCLYSGDVNQDGIIDAQDMAIVDNNIHKSVFGYVPADVNGDSIVDSNDMVIIYDNSYNFVSSKKPVVDKKLKIHKEVKQGNSKE